MEIDSASYLLGQISIWNSIDLLDFLVKLVNTRNEAIGNIVWKEVD